MVRAPIRRVKPKRGFAHFLHLSLVAIVPPLAFVFVRLDIIGLAVAVVLLSKWRMFAVQPRYWIAHFRTNAVDIIVSLSLLSFMITSNSYFIQVAWLVVFEVWVLYLKPGTSAALVMFQSFVSLLVGTVAFFLVYESAPAAVYVILAAVVSYFSARHFFGAFEEAHATQYSWLWAYFSAALVWVLTHWLLFYGPVAQPAVILGVIGYALAGLYYLHEHDKLTNMVRRQIIFVAVAIIFLIVVITNWGDGVIK